jgi:hypothetical protein
MAVPTHAVAGGKAKPIAPNSVGSKPAQDVPTLPQTPASDKGFSLSDLAGQFGEMIDSATSAAKRKAKSKPLPNKTLFILGAFIGGGLLLALIGVALLPKSENNGNDGTSGSNSQAARSGKKGYAELKAEGKPVVKSFDDVPPPVMDAIKAGAEVWYCPEYYRDDDGRNRSYTPCQTV